MNSLNAVLEWLEESPDKGIEFIHALSDEFRTFSQVSDEKLISVKTELRMCRSHLKIMQFRKDIKLRLTTENVDETKKIPPAIFHTVIENGITHAPPDSLDTSFLITEEKLGNGIRYKILSRHSYEILDDIKINHKEYSRRHTPHRVIEGTGYSYIKARMTESYGKNYSITSKKFKFGWETIIEIYDIKNGGIRPHEHCNCGR